MTKPARDFDLDAAIGGLGSAVESEAQSLADRVRKGEILRSDLKDALRQYGDGEVVMALAILDGEGAS